MYWLRNSDHMAKEGSRFQQCSTCLLILPAFLYFTLPAEYSFISFFKYFNSNTTLFSVICSWGLVRCVCVCMCTHSHTCTYVHTYVYEKWRRGWASSSVALHFNFKLFYYLFYLMCGETSSAHILQRTYRPRVHRDQEKVLNFLKLELQMMWGLV